MTKFNHDSFNKRTGHAFPIKQHRFNTSNHPVVTITAALRAKLSTVLSANEQQMLEAIENFLQQDENTSVRIVLHEMCRAEATSFDSFLEKSSPVSTCKGHTGRDIKQVIKLTGVEKKAVEKLAKQLKISDKEIVRLGLIWFNRGVRGETISHLENSSKISQMECFREWSKTHDGSPSKLKELRGAQKENYESAKWEAIDRNYQIYKERGEYVEFLKMEGLLPVDQFGDVNIDGVNRMMADDFEVRIQSYIKTLGECDEYLLKEALQAFFEVEGYDPQSAEVSAEVRILMMKEETPDLTLEGDFDDDEFWDEMPFDHRAYTPTLKDPEIEEKENEEAKRRYLKQMESRNKVNNP